MFVSVREKGRKVWYFSMYLECVKQDVQVRFIFVTNSYKCNLKNGRTTCLKDVQVRIMFSPVREHGRKKSDIFKEIVRVCDARCRSKSHLTQRVIKATIKWQNSMSERRTSQNHVSDSNRK